MKSNHWDWEQSYEKMPQSQRDGGGRATHTHIHRQPPKQQLNLVGLNRVLPQSIKGRPLLLSIEETTPL